MPLWAWITLVALFDALFWSFVVHRSTKRLKDVNLKQWAFAQQFSQRVSGVLEAAKGDRHQLLSDLKRDMAKHVEDSASWPD